MKIKMTDQEAKDFRHQNPNALLEKIGNDWFFNEKGVTVMSDNQIIAKNIGEISGALNTFAQLLAGQTKAEIETKVSNLAEKSDVQVKYNDLLGKYNDLLGKYNDLLNKENAVQVKFNKLAEALKP